MRYIWLAGLFAAITVAACGKSGPTATGTAPSEGEKLKQDLSAVGHDIKEAATQAAADAKPAMQNATQKGKEMIHEGAQKVADWTATQPATPAIPR